MARTPPPPAQQDLLNRLREYLVDEQISDERSMFGGVCVMVRGKILVSAGKDGGLLVRVDADRHDELVARPGARQAEMGAGRDMGPGWITVTPDGVDSDPDLGVWLDAALEYNCVAADGRR